MTSIAEYADAALRIKPTLAPHLGMPVAIRKAIEGKGVRNPVDIRHLTRKVASELAERSKTARACQREFG